MALWIVPWKIFAAGVLGAGCGWLAAKMYNAARRQEESRRRDFARQHYAHDHRFVADETARGRCIWAVFAAALFFTSLLPGDQRRPAEAYQEGGVYLTMVPALLIFGMTLRYARWEDYGVAGLLTILSLLLFRRLPIIGLLYKGMRKRRSHPYAFRTRMDWFSMAGSASLVFRRSTMRPRPSGICMIRGFGKSPACASALRS